MSLRSRLPGFGRPVAPFVGIVSLAFAAAFLRTADTDWALVAWGAAAAALVAGVAYVTPWSRFDRSMLLLLPIACDAVIGVLRHAQGGSTSGYSPLAILPVVWVGLVLSRRAVAAIAGCTGLLFAAPIVVFGPPMYPASQWRGVALWAVVSLVVGLGANRVVTEQRRQAAVAGDRARELDQLVATQTTIATASFDIDAVLKIVVDEAQTLTRADGAVVELPDGDEMVYRAVAGAASTHSGLRLTRDGTLSGEALAAAQLRICDDTETDPRVDRDTCRRIGSRSMIVVPLLHEGGAIGVLKVYSATQHAFGQRDARVLAGLASMIGTALVRAELLRKLTEQAVTDELTGLPNRRGWYSQLDAALARARRSGDSLSVVLLDLDGFKRVNDEEGHEAGDRLLRAVTSRWSDALRETDLLGRVGGDEFAAILDGADEIVAADVVARMGDAIEGVAHASAGVAVWDGREDVTALLRRADDEMYEQKRAHAASPR